MTERQDTGVAEAALERMRKICLALEDTDEASHFGEAAFRVGGKMFASCGVKKGICRIVVQLEPAHATALVESRAGFERYPLAKDCVAIDAARVEDWDEVRVLVLESHGLVVASKRATKKRASTTGRGKSKRPPRRSRS